MVLQRYLAALILSYARKYLRNIEANLNLSLWGGDVVLNNLDIRLDGQDRTGEREGRGGGGCESGQRSLQLSSLHPASS